MKTLHKINIAALVLFIALFTVSCIPEQQSMGDAGQTILKLHPSGYNSLAVDAKTTPQSGMLFEIRRDVPNAAELNTASTVVLQYDTDNAILTKYNTDNETTFIPLPSNLGTVTPAITGGKVTVNFAAGETGLPIMLNIPNAANFDFSKNYALAFKVSSASGTGTLSNAVGQTIVCEVLAKNKYDGIYMMKGFIMRPGDTGGLEGFFKDHKKFLSTTGATSVVMSPNQLWANEGGVGGIGAWTITVKETGTPPFAITITDPIAVNWLMDPTYPNRYDPVKKTFYFKVNWGAAIPYTRGCVDTLVYVSPR